MQASENRHSEVACLLMSFMRVGAEGMCRISSSEPSQKLLALDFRNEHSGERLQ